MSSEFDLIERIGQRIPSHHTVAVGIGDDGCVLSPDPNKQLVCTTDTIVLDRHFTQTWGASQIGHLAMAVNLSDLAAMGADPRWALLSLTLPNHAPWTEVEWLDAFLDGFLAVDPTVVLTGGNMASGPLNIGVTLLGEVNRGEAITRDGARGGDALVVTGQLGDVAGALALSADRHARHTVLTARLTHPTPRVAVGRCAWGHVHAMVDVSDGLLADLEHMLVASADSAECGLGATLWLEALPTSKALAEAFADEHDRWPLQLNGGSDYELLMAVPPDKLEGWLQRVAATGVPASVIGQVTEQPGIELVQPDGRLYDAPTNGWDHFRST